VSSAGEGGGALSTRPGPPGSGPAPSTDPALPSQLSQLEQRLTREREMLELKRREVRKAASWLA
jgi:hypothetical protein